MKPTIPKHLEPPTRKWVKSVLDDYELEDHHIHLLILAAEALDRSNAARKLIDEHGMVYFDKAGQPKPFPAVIIERDAKDLFRRLLRELNLSEGGEENRPPGLKYGGK
jgi:hypothetical protein